MIRTMTGAWPKPLRSLGLGATNGSNAQVNGPSPGVLVERLLVIYGYSRTRPKGDG